MWLWLPFHSRREAGGPDLGVVEAAVAHRAAGGPDHQSAAVELPAAAEAVLGRLVYQLVECREDTGKTWGHRGMK